MEHGKGALDLRKASVVFCREIELQLTHEIVEILLHPRDIDERPGAQQASRDNWTWVAGGFQD